MWWVSSLGPPRLGAERGLLNARFTSKHDLPASVETQAGTCAVLRSWAVSIRPYGDRSQGIPNVGAIRCRCVLSLDGMSEIPANPIEPKASCNSVLDQLAETVHAKSFRPPCPVFSPRHACLTKRLAGSSTQYLRYRRHRFLRSRPPFPLLETYRLPRSAPLSKRRLAASVPNSRLCAMSTRPCAMS